MAAVQRFLVNARAASRLRYPNIVSVLDAGQLKGHQYLVMEYVNGLSLAQMAHGFPLPASRAAAYVRTIAAAVDYAHQHGMLHRQLTPGSILIDEHDQPRLTHFGMVTPVDVSAGALMGTCCYLSPEQVRGDEHLIGGATDVYSLGAVLYELVTGRPPFFGESSTKALAQVLEAQPESPRLLNPTVPRDLEMICLKCLEKNPARRYPTAQAAADLDRFLMERPIVGPPMRPIEKTWRWIRRKRLTASLLRLSSSCWSAERSD